jgi:hypothetical protein
LAGPETVGTIDAGTAGSVSSQQSGRPRPPPRILAPGARIVVRDAEWLVRRVDLTSTGGQAVRVVGISELVRGREAVFLDEIERSMEVLDPVDTKLVQDPRVPTRRPWSIWKASSGKPRPRTRISTSGIERPWTWA